MCIYIHIYIQMRVCIHMNLIISSNRPASRPPGKVGDTSSILDLRTVCKHPRGKMEDVGSTQGGRWELRKIKESPILPQHGPRSAPKRPGSTQNGQQMYPKPQDEKWTASGRQRFQKAPPKVSLAQLWTTPRGPLAI